MGQDQGGQCINWSVETMVGQGSTKKRHQRLKLMLNDQEEPACCLGGNKASLSSSTCSSSLECSVASPHRGSATAQF